MKSVYRIISLVFTVLFAWAAYLQSNDPDPLLWYLFYGTAAISCLLFFFNRFPYLLGLLLGVIYFAGTLWVWPEKFEGVTIGEGNIENIERGREAMGLAIAMIVRFFLAWRSWLNSFQEVQSSRSN